MGLLESMTVPQAVMAAGPQPVQLQPSFSFGTSGANIRLSPKPEPKDRTPPIKAQDLTAAAEGLSKFQEANSLVPKASEYFNSVPAGVEGSMTGGREQGAAMIAPYARQAASNLPVVGGMMDPKKNEAAYAATRLNDITRTLETVYSRVLHGTVRSQEMVNNAKASIPQWSAGPDKAGQILGYGLHKAYGQTLGLILDAQKQGMDQVAIRASMGGGANVAHIIRYGLDNGFIKPSEAVALGWARPKAPDQPGQAAPQPGQPANAAPALPAQAPTPQAQSGIYRKTF